MKTLRRILLVVVLLLVIAGIVVYFYLDRIVKVAVERQSTNSLNLTTTLDGDLPGLGAMKPIEVTIPSLTLKNIGNSGDSQNGAAIKDVVMQLATALASKASSAANLPDQFKNILQSNLNEVAGKLGAEFNKQ